MAVNLKIGTACRSRAGSPLSTAVANQRILVHHDSAYGETHHCLCAFENECATVIVIRYKRIGTVPLHSLRQPLV